MVGFVAVGSAAVADVPGRQVNNPPFGSRAAAQNAQIIAATQPDPWQYVFIGGRGPFLPKPPFAQEEAAMPPFQNPGRSVITAQIIAQQQPDPWVYAFFGGMGPYLRKPPFAQEEAGMPPFQSPGRTPATAAIIAQQQPNPWVYAFIGGAAPYMPAPPPPALIGLPVLIPGSGKRRDFPSYVPQPDYDAPAERPRKRVRPIWDRPEWRQQPKPPGPAKPAVPQLPPLSIFRPPVIAPNLPLDRFERYGPNNAAALQAHMADVVDINDMARILQIAQDNDISDEQDIADMIDVLRALGFIKG